MKQSKLYILIISCLCSFTLHAQSVSEVVKFADNQFEQGNFSIASKEYNRAFFFGYEPKAVVCLKIAQCYQQLSEFELSATFYDHTYRFANNDSIKIEAVLGKAYCLLLQNNYILSLSELLNLPDNCSLDQQVAFHFLKAIANFGIQKDSVSLDEFIQVATFSKLADNEILSLKNEFATIFRSHKKINPQRAYILSAILPGLGQFSVGAFKDGINSLVLIGGLYFLSYNMAITYTFWDAFFTFFPWIQRYYLGGMDKAKGLADSKIDKMRYQSYLKILELTTPNSYQ